MALDFSRTLLLSAGRFSPLTGRDCPATPDPCPTVSPFLAELLGTAILIILGNGVVANVVLHRTKGQNSGWIVITAGWALAVTVAVYAVNSFSGAHLNPIQNTWALTQDEGVNFFILARKPA